MKLNYFQLEMHLKNQLFPLYLISGEELLLKQDALTTLRLAAKKRGFDEQIRVAHEQGQEEKLHHLLHTTSLFAEKQLIELNFRDGMPTQSIGKILQAYAKSPAENRILLIEIGKLDEKNSKSAWYQSLEKIGVAITVWPIPREQLPQWIQQRAKKYQIQFDQAALQLLTDYVEGNLIAASQAIEKIALLRPQKIVDIEIIKAIFIDDNQFTLFNFIENLVARNITRTLNILSTLKNTGTEPVLILWGISRELRILANIATQLKQGEKLETLLQKNRIFARRQIHVRDFLAQFSAEDCWQALTHVAQLDREIKTNTSDIWDHLELFCLRVLNKSLV